MTSTATRRFYGAKRSAPAAAEVLRKFVIGEKAEEMSHGVEQLGTLTVAEMKTVKRLLRSLHQPAEDEAVGP